MTGPIVSTKDTDKPGNPHSEVCELVIGCLLLAIDCLLLVIDHLLLQNLPCGLSSIWHNKSVLAHLILGDCISESFNQFHHLSRIPPLIYESSYLAFFQQYLQSPLNLFQRTAKAIDRYGKVNN